MHGDGTLATRHKFEALRERLLTEDDGATAVINALAYLHRKHPRLSRLYTLTKGHRPWTSPAS